MTYCYTDFLLLYALSCKKGAGLGDVQDKLSSLCPVMPTEGVLNHGLTILRGGGYIELSGDPLGVDSSCGVRLTDRGRAAVKLPFLSRLSGHKAAALQTLEKQFTVSPLENTEKWEVRLAPHVYDTLVQRLENSGDNAPGCSFITLENLPNGIKMHLTKPWETGRDHDGDLPEADGTVSNGAHEDTDRLSLAALVGGAVEDEYVPENKLTATYADGDGGLCDLLSAVHRLVFANGKKTRKACLHNEKSTYVLTLSPQEEGIRVSCAPMRYNQKRFLGKTDSGLDYAQCGDDVLLFTLYEDFLAAMTAQAYAEVWEILPPSARAQAQALHEMSFSRINN